MFVLSVVYLIFSGLVWFMVFGFVWNVWGDIVGLGCILVLCVLLLWISGRILSLRRWKLVGMLSFESFWSFRRIMILVGFCRRSIIVELWFFLGIRWLFWLKVESGFWSYYLFRIGFYFSLGFCCLWYIEFLVSCRVWLFFWIRFLKIGWMMILVFIKEFRGIVMWGLGICYYFRRKKMIFLIMLCFFCIWVGVVLLLELVGLF